MEEREEFGRKKVYQLMLLLLLLSTSTEAHCLLKFMLPPSSFCLERARALPPPPPPPPPQEKQQVQLLSFPSSQQSRTPQETRTNFPEGEIHTRLIFGCANFSLTVSKVFHHIECFSLNGKWVFLYFPKVRRKVGWKGEA